MFYLLLISEENEDAGSPSLLNKLGIAVSVQPKRTLLGDFTFGLLTITLFPSIKALAG